MYLARVRHNREFTYILRESVPEGEGFGHRDLADLGPSPGAWIDYPGGNAWYVSPDLADRVSRRAVKFDADRLEDLFWPFIRPEIRRATETFRQRGTGFKRMSKKEKEALAESVHAFDKRRAHFLKFGNMDQGPLVHMPAILFKVCQNKSRDEIEQYFMAQERLIRARDLKSYVYTVFDIQRFFKSFMAKQMPHVLDQNRVDSCFIQELCRVNAQLFHLKDHLHDDLIRYAVMFFDHAYGDTVLLEDMANDFMFRHSFFTPPPPKPSVSAAKARQIFGLSKADLKAMDRKTLTRRFRRLARTHHPDKGGDHDRFVEINDAYQALLEKMRP